MSLPNSMKIQIVEVVMPGLRAQKNFGIYSTLHHTAMRLTIRFNGPDNAALEQAAALIDVEKHLFIREAAVNMAKAIIKLAEKNNAEGNERD